MFHGDRHQAMLLLKQYTKLDKLEWPIFPGSQLLILNYQKQTIELFFYRSYAVQLVQWRLSNWQWWSQGEAINFPRLHAKPHKCLLQPPPQNHLAKKKKRKTPQIKLKNQLGLGFSPSILCKCVIVLLRYKFMMNKISIEIFPMSWF